MTIAPHLVRAAFLASVDGTPDPQDLAEADELLDQEELVQAIAAYQERALAIYRKWGAGDHLTDEEKVLLGDAQALMDYALDHATPEQIRARLPSALRVSVDLHRKAQRSPITRDLLEAVPLPTPDVIVDRMWTQDPEIALELEEVLRKARWSREAMGWDR